jgi:aspartate/methionine/tyrosine aminotransferase
MENIRVEDHPGMHSYAPVQGRRALLDAIAARTRMTGDRPAERSEILVTAGATGGLYGVAATLCSPGDQVLVIAPFWPLIGNAIECAGGEVVPVPFFETSVDPTSAVSTLDAALTQRTVAVYWNTPHNPTGRLIPGDWLAAMANWARRNDLWIIADEVYEHYAYTAPHTYSRAFAPERTVSAYSFSKAYGMAGNRCGYLIAPSDTAGAIQRITRNSFYSVNTAAQIAAERALSGAGDTWARAASEVYQSLGNYAADRLGVARPEGSTFLFIDTAPIIGAGELDTLLEKCADQGLLVAPGLSFGPYPNHMRVCFTSAAPDLVRGGVEVLAQMLGR